MTKDHTLRQAPPTSTTPPAAVTGWLDGDKLADKVGTAIGVTTVDADGWPHSALLSPGEILLSETGELRIAVHTDSGTTQNLRRDGKVVLTVTADSALYELTFNVHDSGPLTGLDLPLTGFTGMLRLAREHRVPYADVSDGIRYTLHDTKTVINRWTVQISALRRLP